MNSDERKRLDSALSSVDFGPGVLVRGDDGSVLWSGESIPGVTQSGQKVYKKADGTWTGNAIDIAHFSLGEDGAINLTAPKFLYETPEFTQIFDEDTIKSYSAAYRTDPSYRVPYMQRNEDGTTEETQITVPEFVDKLNDALGNFVKNYKIADKNKKALVKQYGDKANNLSLTQLSTIAGATSDANRVYLPDFIFNFENSFAPLKGMRDEDGTVAKEDFMKYYQLGVTSDAELASIMAAIEGHLKASDWGEDIVEFSDGTSMKNANSRTEAVRAMALKNFILSKDPDADWHEALGAGAATLSLNAAEGFTRVFMNLGTFVEGVVTFGQLHVIENATEQLDSSMSEWNQQRTLIQDSAATLSTLGQIGGMIGGTVAEAYLMGKAGDAIAGFGKGLAGKAATKVLTAAETDAAVDSLMASAASGESFASAIATIAANTENISLGAKVVMSVLPVAEKVALATSTAQAFMKAHGALNFATSFLLDTIHDAIFYDAVTLRHVLEGDSDQNVKDYWLGQLEDNAKWWIGTGFAKTSLKLAGTTELGQAVNAKLTQKIQGVMAKAGDAKTHFKDSIYGGDVIRYMQEKVNSLPDGAKKDRLNTKIEIEKANRILRGERKALSRLDLEWDGLKLSDESKKEFQRVLNNIKVFEDAIDARNSGIQQKIQEMVGQVKDPDTGKMVYVNQALGVANTNAGNLYGKMMGYTQDYHLKTATGSNLSQDMVDYLSGQAELARKAPIAENTKHLHYADAKKDVEMIQKNLNGIRNRMPDKVMEFLDDPETLGTYFKFYDELRAYQADKIKIVDQELLEWMRGGKKGDNYMPIYKEQEYNGYFTRKDGTVTRTTDETIREFTYGVKEGQHYVDPEIVRQRMLRTTAEAEISQDMRIAYGNFESATMTELASGKVTKRVKDAKMKVGEMASYIKSSAPAFTHNFDLDVRRPTKAVLGWKNTRFDIATRETIVSSLSMDDTVAVLRDQGVLKSGNRKLSNLVNGENYKTWYDGQTRPVKNYLKSEFSKFEGDASVNNYELFKKAAKAGGSDFEAGLQRAYLIGDEKFAKSATLNQAVRNVINGKEAFAGGFFTMEAKQELSTIKGVNTEKYIDSLYDNIVRGTDDYVEAVMASPKVAKSMEAIAGDAENGSELVARYTVLKHLSKDGRKALNATINQHVENAFKGKNISGDELVKIKKVSRDMALEYIRSETNDARSALRTVNGTLSDSNDFFKQVKDLNREMIGLAKQAKDANSDVIAYRDEMGRVVYSQVDPNFASLYKMRKTLTRGDASAMAKANAAMSKLFRYGTTTLNLTSFSNQLFRDTGNALFVGGAWDTIRHNAENLRDVFGDDIVEHIKNFEPEYEFKQLEEFAKANDMDLKQAAVSRELARGAALSPASTETALYRNLLKDAYAGRGPNSVFTAMNEKLQGVLDKFNAVDEWTNGKRETYLRNRVFANNLSRALEQGYDFGQARAYATYAMDNATTNFARQLYHMQAIADSTPYFKAAINGTKSFWRMWSIDPVGISGRIMGGLILPTIFLTGASLGDPDNKEVYKNIPEYQKQDNLVFVVDKQIVTIPIPQEIANVVTPFRQFVEYLHQANENDFWELMMNDALGFSPVDLTGFSAIDMDKLSGDPTIGDRISRGFAKIFAQVAPVPMKSTYMMVTGTDPYTGKSLYDPSYTYWDDATNSVQTMDYTQNAFAKWAANLWGKESNAKVLESVTSGIFGSTGSNFLGQVVTLFEKGVGAAGETLAGDVINQATKPYYATVYEQSDAIWRRAVQALTVEKERVTNSDEFKAIYSELSQTTDPDKRRKLSASGQNLINEYQNKVITIADRLVSVYKGTLDRKKMGALIQLLNFNTSPIYQSGTQYSSDIASEAFYEGRDSAISTLQAMGVTGTSDLSIFGYLVTNDEGKSVMKYSEPVAIMDMRNAWMGAGDIDQANIEAKLKTDGIKTSAKWDGYYTAKAQGKAALKQYKNDWNAKVVKSLAPYISERGVDAVLKNSNTKQLLNEYLFIDNQYQIKAYLKKIFENK